MKQITRTFYQYLGLHSLLIGIFPFFIPVFLWNQGFGLGEICLFIGAAGGGFCLGLWAWDRLRHIISLTSLIAVSLVMEIGLLLNVQILGMSVGVLAMLGISYGAYNCFFWTTQRALFFERVDNSNSGRKYGNLQIYVGLLLQVGILAGGFLLESAGFTYILICSGLLCVAGLITFYFSKPETPPTLARFKPVSLRDIRRFRDNDASRMVFIIDGIYLFLESFFWVISLFLLAHESFTRLGFMVLSLAIIFGILFYLLKNTIDRLARNRIYQFAVWLYAFSWVLRAIVDTEDSLFSIFLSLVLITFCTSFFRLAMNKRFYDLARDTISHRYLILKSYYSQITILVVFTGFAMFQMNNTDSETLLVPIYWIAAIFALLFLSYGADRYDHAGEKHRSSGSIVGGAGSHTGE